LDGATGKFAEFRAILASEKEAVEPRVTFGVLETLDIADHCDTGDAAEPEPGTVIEILDDFEPQMLEYIPYSPPGPAEQPAAYIPYVPQNIPEALGMLTTQDHDHAELQKQFDFIEYNNEETAGQPVHTAPAEEEQQKAPERQYIFQPFGGASSMPVLKPEDVIKPNE